MIEKAVEYIQGVKSGKILSCDWIKLAIDRHLNDLKKEMAFLL